MREDRVNLLMIIIDEKLFYLAVKKLSALLRGITSKYNDGVCCINCLHSLITSNKLGKKTKTDDYCHVKTLKRYMTFSNHGHNIFRLLPNFPVFYQIFLSPQVKRSVIISNKYSIYLLLHELHNELRLMILGN